MSIAVVPIVLGLVGLLFAVFLAMRAGRAAPMREREAPGHEDEDAPAEHEQRQADDARRREGRVGLAETLGHVETQLALRGVTVAASGDEGVTLAAAAIAADMSGSSVISIVRSSRQGSPSLWYPLRSQNPGSSWSSN